MMNIFKEKPCSMYLRMKTKFICNNDHSGVGLTVCTCLHVIIFLTSGVKGRGMGAMAIPFNIQRFDRPI